jgi:acyl-CoA thioesterase-1
MKPHYFLLVLFLIIAPLQAKNIVVIGDSLSAGYGIDPQKGWVSLLATKLANQGQFKIINLSTSGDTTSNGLAKLAPALKKYQPDILILALGSNDGLRGLALSQIKNNLEAMVSKGKKAGAKIIILATYLPPNYGAEYLNQFNAIYLDLAKRFQVALVPMFLEGVAGNDQLMQHDGLHPNEKAQALILDNVWPALTPLL